MAVVMCGCSTTTPPPDSETVPPPGKASAVAGYDVGVAAFRDVCVDSAPSFNDAPAVAKKYGVDSLASGVGGMTKDGSLSVQIKPASECAVTTANRPGNAVTKQFLSTVTAATGSTARQTPLVAKIRGSTFIFMHERNGGEAFVMLMKPN